jgi:hypothetical protein
MVTEIGRTATQPSASRCVHALAALKGGNLASGRKLTANGKPSSWTSNWSNRLPAKRKRGYCVQTSAGNYAWADFATW